MNITVSNMKTIEEKLAEYSSSLGLHESMTIDSLIASHRHLREKNVETNVAFRESIQAAIDKAEKDVYEYALVNNYIKVSVLGEMTFNELSEYIENNK